MMNRQWLLQSRPQGQVTEAHFECREAPLPSPKDGEFVVRTLYVSFDPAMRGWMNEDPGYMPPIALGSVMGASGVGEIVESRHQGYRVGDIVVGMLGWQEYALIGEGGPFAAQRIDAEHPLPSYLGILGGTGLTAYFGLLDVGQPTPGDTVVVSGAAGATGSVAAQIAKIKKCRVIGIAGGPAKCRCLTDDLGLDAAIDYKSENVGARLGELCPDGINVYFDNVGGSTLEAAIDHMALHGRIPLCGMISGYNAEQSPGPHNLFLLIAKRIRMEGFLIPDYFDRFEVGRRELSEWLAAGQLKALEDVQEGFENIPSTFLRLFQGANLGKQVLKMADPSATEGA
jgi:hypothetical protein